MSCFKVNTKIFTGEKKYSECIDTIGKISHGPCLVLADDVVLKNYPNIVENITRLLESWQLVYYLEAMKINGEPTYDFVDEQFKRLKTKGSFEYIVAIGGGSLMDVAKAIAILYTNDGNAINYRGMDKVNHPSLPVICVPTTAGSGSEVTHTAALIDTKEKRKLGINGKYVTPFATILEPNYLMNQPENVMLFSKLDAILHAAEAITSKQSTTISKVFGHQALCLLESIEVEKIQLGATLAGIAMMNAAGGIASAISYPLGSRFGVPHGLAGGIFLPYEFELNDVFCCKIPLSRKLSDYGYKIDVDELVEATWTERKDVLDLNPYPITKEELRKLIESVQ